MLPRTHRNLRTRLKPVPYILSGALWFRGTVTPPPFTFSCFNSNTWGKEGRAFGYRSNEPQTTGPDRVIINGLTCSQILRKRRHLKPSPSEPAERLGKIGQQQQQDPQKNDEHRVTYHTW